MYDFLKLSLHREVLNLNFWLLSQKRDFVKIWNTSEHNEDRKN